MNSTPPESLSVAAQRSRSFILDLTRSALRRRRIRLWAAALLVVVGVLGLHAAMPRWNYLADLGIDLAPTTVLLVFLAALCCEYMDSSLGMGYGTTLTPVLLAAGFEPLQIVPAVLFSECLSGISAGLLHHRDGNMDLIRDPRVRKTVLWLSTLSMIGVVAAVTVALHISKFWLTTGIGSIILLMGVIILMTIRRQLTYRPKHLIAVGAVAAFNKGLSGGGYGPLVTAGQVVSGISGKQAVGITSLAEGLTCFVGLVAYLLMHRHFAWSLAAPLTLGALFSVPIATLTVRRMPENLVRGAVGGVTLLLGALTLLKLMLR
ncbi:MAG: sulfite exporter TauE/SafE family protein [Phycisphaerae bacterium]|nr:sulfite exporter TauE/SafE family protein [Phycisphaerae bacterium]